MRNVVMATNGETVTETLGSGDAGEAFQTFTLKQTPLTWTSAPVPSGIAAAMTVRVNGIAWTLVPYLYGAGRTDRVYTLDRDINGNTIVRFGDGITGARLPSGTENVTALYRRGLGTQANVAGDAITMLITRPPGLRDVTNPLAASGGDDPETVTASRTNAPFSVKTLGRIVTLDDYADFARASTGVAKARVDLTFAGATQIVLVTVAGPQGAQIPVGSDQYNDLLQALTNASDGSYPLLLASYRPIMFSVGASLVLHPAYDQQAVYAAVQAALASAFSFDARAFGQPVYASEVYAAIQSVPGVLAENLTALCYAQTVPPAITDPLTAQAASISGGTAVGAQLLTLDIIPATFHGARMILDADALYNLLPAVYRERDAALGISGGPGPLADILGIIAGQLGLVDAEIDQLYDDAFIETCAPWVVPYIGDLIGYLPLSGTVPGAMSDRAEVANTIEYRRWKGTATILEQLAADVTGWTAVAVEFFERLTTTQYVNHVRLASPEDRRRAALAGCVYGRNAVRSEFPLGRSSPHRHRTGKIQHPECRRLRVAPGGLRQPRSAVASIRDRRQPLHVRSDRHRDGADFSTSRRSTAYPSRELVRKTSRHPLRGALSPIRRRARSISALPRCLWCTTRAVIRYRRRPSTFAICPAGRQRRRR